MAAPLTPNASSRLLRHGDVANLANIGGVLLIACVFAVVAVGRPKPAEFLGFVFLAGAAPPLAAISLFALRGPAAARYTLAARVFVGLSLVGALFLGAIEFFLSGPLRSPFFFLLVVLCGAAGGIAILKSDWLGGVRRRAATGELDVALIALLVLVAIVFSPFLPDQGIPTVADYVQTAPRVLPWLIFGIVVVGIVSWLRRYEASHVGSHRALIERLALAVFILFIFSLFDDELYLNADHYLVHLGPAMHAIHGGIAMVDTYCIYGLMPWLLVKAALTTLAPTYGAMAVVVRLSTLAYYIVMGVSLYALARRRLSALLLMMPLILVAVTFHPGLLNLNGLPSTSGLRYLVPALMVMVLVTVKSAMWSRLLATALLVLASLWSVETFVYTLAPWGYVLFLQTVRTRSIVVPGATLLGALALVVLAHVAFAYWTHYTTGQWVDYGPYLGLIDNFRPDRAGFWAQPANPNFATWVPIWLGLFLVLAAAGYQALRGSDPTDTATRLVPVAALGFAELNYYAGFPAWSSLGLAFLPAAVVIVCIIEVLAEYAKDNGRAAVALFWVLSGVAVGLIAFGTERFARPILYDQANQTVLRRCFTADGCQLTTIADRLARKVSAKPLDPAGPFYQTLHDNHPVNMPQWYRDDSLTGYERVKELVSILRQLEPRGAPLALVVDTHTTPYISVAALMETGQWYRWPISSPLNDDISAGVTSLILARMGKTEIRNDELVVVSNVENGPKDSNGLPARDSILDVEQKMLAVIRGRCDLKLVEAQKFHSIFRTSSCASL